MKIALVHDDFLRWGGAERVVAAMAEMWPNAPIYTSIANPQVLGHWFAGHEVRQSFLQNFPILRGEPRLGLPLYPLAFRQFDFSDFDVVLSSTTRFAHTIKTPDTARHVAYCHAPPRFLYDFSTYVAHETYQRQIARVVTPWLGILRAIDQQAARRVTAFIANSQNVADKIADIYQRKADVISPFVDLTVFTPTPTQKVDDYFLVVSRLVAWKRVDLAIEACKRLKKRLIIIGKGSDKARLQAMAVGSRTEFLSDLTDRELVRYYRGCQSLLVTQNEDFGLAILEAQACGRPVIAFNKGGARETVVGGITGDFFAQQSVPSLHAKIRHFDPYDYEPERCRANAKQFSKYRFQKSLGAFIGN